MKSLIKWCLSFWQELQFGSAHQLESGTQDLHNWVWHQWEDTLENCSYTPADVATSRQIRMNYLYLNATVFSNCNVSVVVACYRSWVCVIVPNFGFHSFGNKNDMRVFYIALDI